MGSSVADLFVVLDSVTDPFSSGMRKAAADAESESRRMSGALGLVAKAGVGLTVGVAGIGIASIKAATEFQTQMTRLYTAAGAPKAAVQQATGAVLQLGTQVGMTGTQIAEALYHPVSAGLDLATSLQVVKYAAEEAQISGANLDDTTYSLSSVMKAFNFPASQAAQTMATLNAVVGDGDMRFQDFNVSIKNWAPTAAQMGMSVTSMGAGLAYLTDRGNSAEEASTRLTMGISMMATPSKKAADLLEGLGVASGDVKGSTAAMTKVLQDAGITQNQLAADLAKPDGLYVALTHLKSALEKAGVSGTEADSAIAKIFGGGRSDKAILSLMQNLDGLKQKYDQITADSTTKKFEANWQSAKDTFSFQVQQMKAAVENWGISLGTKALPALSSFIATAETDLGGFFSQFSAGFSGSDLKAPKVDFKNSRLNQDQLSSSLRAPQTAFERFGQSVRSVLGDVERFGARLEPIGRNFTIFGEDAFQAGEKIVQAVTPAAQVIGGALFLAVETAGKAAADILGPAIKWVANFLEQHQGAVKYFSEVILGGLILKMTILGGINAAKGIVDLAAAVVGFPLSQTSQIGGALGALKTAYTGKDAKEGEDAVKGLKGAVTDLKGAVSTGLDKLPMLDGLRLKLMGVKNEADGLEQAGANAETGLSAVAAGATEAEGAAAKAEEASSGLLGKVGKFALVGGGIGAAVFGLVTLGQTLGEMAGVGDHTAMALDQVNSMFSLVTAGSAQADSQLTQTAAKLVAIADISGGKASAGLNQVDQGLAQMVTSGHAEQAKAQFQAIAQALTAQGLDAQQAASKFPQYEQAVKNAGDAAQTMDGQVQGMMTTIAKQQAVTQFNSDLQNLTQSIQANGRTLSGNTQQAIGNQQAFQQAAQDVLQYYQQQRNANVPIQQATKDMLNQVTQLEQTGIQAGLTKGQVDQYLGALHLLPSQIQTTITANTSQAMNALGQLQGMLDAALSAMNSIGTTATVDASNFAHQLNHLPHKASGGPVEAGRTYIVGEQGPEIVTFGASGYVTPNSMLQPAALAGSRPGGFGGGGVTVVNNYITNVGGSVLSDKKLGDVVRTVVLKYAGRNSANGLSL